MRRFAFYFMLLTCLAVSATGKPAKPLINKPLIRMSAMRQEMTRGKQRVTPLPGFSRLNFPHPHSGESSPSAAAEPHHASRKAHHAK